MRGNSFGQVFCVTTFGESHGVALGAVIDGCPAGVVWQQELFDQFLRRRRPGLRALTSARQEADEARVLSGVYENKTLGTPIAAVIFNQDARSEDYKAQEIKTRRGHATDLWQEKYGHSDPRGSGRASGRETVSRILGGSVARMLVEQLYPQARVIAFTERIGSIGLENHEILAALKILHASPWSVDNFSLRCPSNEKNAYMQKLLEGAMTSGESFGGIASIYIEGLPRGLGQPVFTKLKNSLGSAFLSIGATNGVEVGSGFTGAAQSGLQFHDDKQDYGGLRGGISTGDTVQLRVAFKPTSSRADVARKGRHDPCIVPRALPVLEAMTWIVLADQILLARLDRI